MVNKNNNAVKEKKHSIKKKHQTLRVYLKGLLFKINK